MNLGHPALKDMITLGCKSQVKIFLAFQTYMELCEVHKVQDVSYHYCPDLDIIYLVASTFSGEEVYISLSENDSVSPCKFQLYKKFLLKTTEKKTFFIVLRSIDTSSIIYKISDGLENPISPEVSKEKRDLKEKRNLIEVEISNLLPSLIQEAREKKQND